MRKHLNFYIGGEWVAPTGTRQWDVVNPATEDVAGTIAMGEPADVDAAVAAARAAFISYSRTSREERVAHLEDFLDQFERRVPDLCEAISEEMGSPNWTAREAHAVIPVHHLKIAIESLRAYEFEKQRGITTVRLQPIGVVGLITPWNLPAAVVMSKVAPALAVGCTVVLKPSEYSPFSSQIFAEIIEASSLPAGSLNMVFGDGPTVGSAMSSHPDIDMISITGSTRAGIEVARAAAPTIKRVHQELGGKSPNVILESSDVAGAVARGVAGLFFNAGQSCAAPSRMLVPASRLDEAYEAARQTATLTTVGPPGEDPTIGPVVNRSQYEHIQELIQSGIDEGATLLAGGTGRAEGHDKGYYVKPTVFGDVTSDMRISREEIFGPVLVMQPYANTADAIEQANDTEYGLAAYVQGGDLDEVREVASQIPAGQVFLNGSGLDLLDLTAPFGGLKKSGNGREWGDFAFESFLEPVSYVGYTPAPVDGSST